MGCDCAAITQVDGQVSPPTAQHALRQAKTCAENILAAIDGRAPRRFVFKALGVLASLGQRSAVAELSSLSHLRPQPDAQISIACIRDLLTP